MVWAFQIGGKFFSREFGEMMYRTSSLAADWNKGDSWVAAETVGATFNESNTSAYFPMQWWANGRTCRYDGDTIGSWMFTDMALFSATYFRMKNVTIGYTIPKKVLSKINISGLRAYVSADNLVFFSRSKDPQMIERDILYSILDKDPKRAKAYWFLNIKTTDQPFEKSYTVETYGTEYIFFVTITLGFKVPQRVNMYLRQIVQDLIDTGELPEQERKFSIYGPSPIGNFKFCFIRNNLTAMDTPTLEYHLVNFKYRIRRQIGDHIKWYGLENSQLIIEYVPLFFASTPTDKLERIEEKN
jgi:K+ transporter